MARPIPDGWIGRRYTDVPFPPYRFVPGLHPHPTADPNGHSFHHAVPTAAIAGISAERWSESSDYLFGVDLHNHGFWWEAHEAWEGVWRTAGKQTTPGRFLQGLIQTAALHLKFHQGQRAGFDRLWVSSRTYLAQAMAETVAGRYLGLSLPTFLASVEAYYDALPFGSPHDPRRFAYLELAE